MTLYKAIQHYPMLYKTIQHVLYKAIRDFVRHYIALYTTVAHMCQYTHKIEYRNQSQKRNSKLKTLVQIINSQFKIINSKFKIINSQFKIVNSQFKIINSQFKIVNSQFKIVNSQFKIVNSQFKIVNSQLSTHLPRPPGFSRTTWRPYRIFCDCDVLFIMRLQLRGNV